MLPIYWIMRMKRWVQHPPSPRMVAFVFAVVAVCAALYAWDLAFGWPDWLTPNQNMRRGGLPLK